MPLRGTAADNKDQERKATLAQKKSQKTRRVPSVLPPCPAYAAGVHVAMHPEKAVLGLPSNKNDQIRTNIYLIWYLFKPYKVWDT
jgi:hypothetical protein